MRNFRKTNAGMQEWTNAGMQEWTNAGMQEWTNSEMQEWTNAGCRNFGNEMNAGMEAIPGVVQEMLECVKF